MTMWSDNRNHLLDDVLRDSAFVLVGLLVGIPPGQFVAVVAFTQLMESLSHANVRLSFGPVLERVLVSPRYHRLHHAIGLGHESAGARQPGRPQPGRAVPGVGHALRHGALRRALRTHRCARSAGRPGLRPWFLGPAVAGAGAPVLGAPADGGAAQGPTTHYAAARWLTCGIRSGARLLYCLHPRVMLWSLLPLLLAGAAGGWPGLGALGSQRGRRARRAGTVVAAGQPAALAGVDWRAPAAWLLAPLVVVALACRWWR
jgi:hypothetical protein